MRIPDAGQHICGVDLVKHSFCLNSLKISFDEAVAVAQINSNADRWAALPFHAAAGRVENEAITSINIFCSITWAQSHSLFYTAKAGAMVLIM